MNIKSFTFNPFAENTYVLWSEKRNAIIIDPGCFNNYERSLTKNFISDKVLKISRLINTHCHIDHVLGNKFIADNYSVLPEYHVAESKILKSIPQSASAFGIPAEPSPLAKNLIHDKDIIELDELKFEVLLTPGHSPGSVCLVNHDEEYIIGGDVLFHRSIGRTDLPFGDHETLITSIRTRLFTLPDEYLVYPGHGPTTTIGEEKLENPFLN